MSVMSLHAYINELRSECSGVSEHLSPCLSLVQMLSGKSDWESSCRLPGRVELMCPPPPSPSSQESTDCGL